MGRETLVSFDDGFDARFGDEFGGWFDEASR